MPEFYAVREHSTEIIYSVRFSPILVTNLCTRKRLRQSCIFSTSPLSEDDVTIIGSILIRKYYFFVNLELNLLNVLNIFNTNRARTRSWNRKISLTIE